MEEVFICEGCKYFCGDCWCAKGRPCKLIGEACADKEV